MGQCGCVVGQGTLVSLGAEGITFCSGLDLPRCFYCLELCGLPGCGDCDRNKSGDNQQVYEISNPSGASTPSETALLDIVFSVKVVNHEQTSEGDPPPNRALVDSMAQPSVA